MNARRWFGGAALLATWAVLSAHVGSPDTVWEGTAGPYPIRVIVRDPGVIPGLAEIVVRTAPRGIKSVNVTAAIWNGAGSAAPPPDTATRVPGDSTLWSARLWFMAASSYAVRVTVVGDGGPGTAVVPFVARATRTLPLPWGLRALLVVLGLLLVAGLVTIVMAGTRESTVPPGAAPAPARRRTATIAGVGAVVILCGVLWFGDGWWNSEAQAYARSIAVNQPFRTTAAVTTDSGHAVLRITIDDSLWQATHGTSDPTRERRGWTPLIPDHGKLMHAFLIEINGDGFAHLHPLSLDSTSFVTNIPPLPAGDYRFFGDIVHESGWSETLTASVTVPAPPPVGRPPKTAKWTATDVDDAWSDTPAATDTVADVGDGFRLVWTRGAAPVVAGADARLDFRVQNADGTPARIQLYMGMPGHLALVRDDGQVYMHLHPMGTAPMAASDAAMLRRPGDSVPGRLGARLTATTVMTPDVQTSVRGVLHFPYEFPQPGSYRVWVQFRERGVVRTAAFHVNVVAPPAR